MFALISSMHKSVTLRLLSSPFHPTSCSSYSPAISSSSCCPSTSTRISSNTAYSANKEMGSTDESCSLTETALENLCSNLPNLEVPSCLHLLHLTCLFLVFLLKCCNGSSLKPARWLQRSQSLSVQEIQSAKDIDLTCFKTFPIKAATCLQVGPTSLDKI